MDAVHLALPDLETGLAELGTSPQDNGTVAMIVCRPDFGQRQVLEAAEIDTTQGLVGDNWLTRGSRHTEDSSANPGQQIAIMNSRVIQAITLDESRWALAGDQLFLDLDLSAENLPPGQRITVGTVVLEISEIPHNGCGKFTERFGSGATHFVNSKEGRELRRRGVNARVIQSGTVRTGDIVKKITT